MIDSDELRRRIARQMTEDELLTAILEAAAYLGWMIYHVRRSDLGIVQGTPGFPDLVLAKGGRTLFLELKSWTGHLTDAQRRWLEAIGDGAQIVTPDRLDSVLRDLGANLG